MASVVFSADFSAEVKMADLHAVFTSSSGQDIARRHGLVGGEKDTSYRVGELLKDPAAAQTRNFSFVLSAQELFTKNLKDLAGEIAAAHGFDGLRTIGLDNPKEVEHAG